MNIKLSKRTFKRRFSKSKTVKQFSKNVSKKISKKTSTKVRKNTNKQTSKKENGKQEIFFMGIFDNIIKCNNKEILIIYNKEGEIWFKMINILIILDYDVKKAKNRIIINEANKKRFNEINDIRGTYMSPIHPNTYFINEAGLYQLLTKSAKPIAKDFMNKYFTDIMPTIRKTGKYIMKEEDKEKLDKINTKLNNYKKELEYYSNKYSLFFSIKKTNRVKKIKIS